MLVLVPRPAWQGCPIFLSAAAIGEGLLVVAGKGPLAIVEKVYRRERRNIRVEIISLSFSFSSSSFSLSLSSKSRLTRLAAISIEEELLLMAPIYCDF